MVIRKGHMDSEKISLAEARRIARATLPTVRVVGQSYCHAGSGVTRKGVLASDNAGRWYGPGSYSWRAHRVFQQPDVEEI